jgi:hypothetical protein
MQHQQENTMKMNDCYVEEEVTAPELAAAMKLSGTEIIGKLRRCKEYASEEVKQAAIKAIDENDFDTAERLGYTRVRITATGQEHYVRFVAGPPDAKLRRKISTGPNVRFAAYRR